MQIEKIPVDKLIPDPNNARKHDEKNLSAIKGSLSKFEQQKPIVIDSKNVVIAGNGTLEAAKALGWTHIDCVRSKLSTNTDKVAFALADNRSAELASWDDEVLGKELHSLFEDGFEIADIGFDPGDFDLEPVGNEGLTDPDEVPEVEDNVFGVKRGDVWLLGEHRVMCGDSTEKVDVERLMAGEKADMVFTDPPYNIASDSKNYAKDTSKAMNDLANSEWDKEFDINPAMDRIRDIASTNCTIYVWTSQFLIQNIWDKLGEWCDFTSYCVWNKPNPMPSLSKRHWTWNTELCVYASIGSKRTVNFPNDGHALSTWTVTKKSDGTHPTQKPIELIQPIIEFSSNKGQLISDPFLGSGSTLIACEKTGRKCYGMEIDPHYVSVIIKRWQDFTGKTATHIERSRKNYLAGVESINIRNP